MHDTALIQKHTDSTEDERMVQSGFKKHTGTTENSQNLSLCMKDPREVVKAQVAQPGFQDFLMEQSDSVLMTHL